MKGKFAKSLRKPTPYALATMLTSFGGLLFGLDTGCIGPITVMPQLLSVIGPLTSTMHGVVVSTILIPAAITSFFAGHVADRLGRRRAIALGAAIFGIGTTLEAATVALAMLLVGRVVTGVGQGLFLSTLVVYICEIAPPLHRGPLASLPQLLVTLGVCAGYFVCYGSVHVDSSLAWRLPFALQAALAYGFSVACLALLWESPRWLARAGKPEEAERVWDALGVGAAEREKAEEIPLVPAPDGAAAQVVRSSSSARNAEQSEQRERGVKLHTLMKVFGKGVRSRTLLGVFLMGMQQLSGIDGVLYYAPLLFQQAGLNSSSASFLASGVSAILMFLVTIPATLFSDRWGRRTSTITGGLILTFCMLLIGSLYASSSVHSDRGSARWVVIVAIYLFAVSFCTTWAVGIKVYASEIQPPDTRAAATSLAYSSNWVVNWIVAFTTPIFLAGSSSGAYFLFGAATAVTVVVCIVFMPETKGRSLESIDEAFRSGGNRKEVGLVRVVRENGSRMASSMGR